MLRGRRKSIRPLGIKNVNHLVLKAKDPWLLLKNSKQAAVILKKYARRFGIIIYSFAVHGDHVHICFRAKSRDSYKKWIRSVTSVLVQKIKGLKFRLRPWSRIVTWGRAFKNVLNYIEFNKTEARFILDALTRMDNFALKITTNHHLTTPNTR